MLRKLLFTVPAIVVLTCGATTLTGCGSDDIEPEPVVHTPLDLDPTEDVEIAEWWTTGKRLLHLYDDGRYALYSSTNRYDTPVERGRWSQGSYAALWMEPYTTQHRRVRVSISKVNGELRLDVPKVGELRPLEQPPRVVEDRLVGLWKGPLGDLYLYDNMLFEYKRVRGDTSLSPLPTTGQWRITDKSVTLLPDSPAYQTTRLNMNMSNEGMILESSFGTFQREGSDRITTETSDMPH